MRLRLQLLHPESTTSKLSPGIVCTTGETWRGPGSRRDSAVVLHSAGQRSYSTLDEAPCTRSSFAVRLLSLLGGATHARLPLQNRRNSITVGQLLLIWRPAAPAWQHRCGVSRHEPQGRGEGHGPHGHRVNSRIHPGQHRKARGFFRGHARRWWRCQLHRQTRIRR